MRDTSLKQRIPCIICISIFGAFSVGKKCALYMGKYSILAVLEQEKFAFFSPKAFRYSSLSISSCNPLSVHWVSNFFAVCQQKEKH